MSKPSPNSLRHLIEVAPKSPLPSILGLAALAYITYVPGNINTNPHDIFTLPAVATATDGPACHRGLKGTMLFYLQQPQLSRLEGKDGKEAKERAWDRIRMSVARAINHTYPQSNMGFQVGVSVNASGDKGVKTAVAAARALTYDASVALTMPVGSCWFDRAQVNLGEPNVATLTVDVTPTAVNWGRQAGVIPVHVDPAVTRH